MNVKERVESLRKLMKSKGIDAYIVPSSDANLSEYVAEHWKCREWISGFTGSAGTAVILKDKAGLWADGRYYIQAERQLKNSGIDLYKIGKPNVPTFVQWVNDNITDNSSVGFDGKVIAISQVKEMENLFNGKNVKIISKYDLIGDLWNDRPDIPKDKIYIHDVKYAGKTRIQKISELRKEMKNLGGDNYLLSSLDDIAWLLNIRGNDVPNNPVVTSYVLVSMNETYLFIDLEKVDNDVKATLENDGVKVLGSEEVVNYVSRLGEKNSIILDENKTNVWLYNSINSSVKIINTLNVTTKFKSVKNDIEIENIKRCHIRDGVAMVKFIKWLKEAVKNKTVTEMSADEVLNKFRKQQKNWVMRSFDTIAGYKEHAAMMHYKATPESDYQLKPEGFFLVDSGAQYLDGTIDITRTFVLGPISEEEKTDFTLVLKSHIDLISTKFLYGATGSNLDVIARKPMWERGLDYKCGTGHGVGFFLNVHEGPQNLSQRPNNIVLEKGMIITNEPGIYKENKHGIRTENEMLVVEDEKTEFGQFMRFESVTYCPIDIEGIKVEMLTEAERNWLNSYHSNVYELLSPYLNDDEKTWLRNATRAI